MFTFIYKNILRLSILFLFFSKGILFAQDFEKKINVYFQNAPLTTVLKFISEKNSVYFVYDQNIVTDKIISCSFQNKPLNFVLNKILIGTGLKIGYQEDNLITLIEAEPVEYDISGQIIDAESKEPLPFANVIIEKDNLAAVTDKNGNFSFVNLKKCSINLKIKYLGYYAKNLKIDCQKQSKIKIELKRSPFIMENIEVVDSKSEFVEVSDFPSFFAVSPRNYDNLPIFSTPDLIRSLQLLPGISTNNGGTAELFIRGGMPSENLMTLDGLQLYHLNHFYGFYSSLSPNSIKDIRIYKGGFPAKYGSKISGVIDMSSKNGSLNKPNFKLGISNINIEITGEIPVTDKLTFFVSGRKIIFSDYLASTYKSLIENKVAGDNFIGMVDYDGDPKIFFADFFSKVTYLASDKDVFNASFLFTEDDNKILFRNIRRRYDAESNKIVAESVTDNEENSFWGNKGFSLNWFRMWNSRFKTNLSISSSIYNSNYNYTENSSETLYRTYYFDQLNDLSHSTISLDVNYNSSDYFNSEFGISYNNSDIKYKSKLESEGQITNSDDNTYQIAAYFQNDMKINKNFNLIAGIRSTYNLLTDKVYLEPRLMLNYKFNENWLLKSSLGKYYQFIVKNIDGNSHLNGNVAWISANRGNTKVSSANHYTVGAKYEDDNVIFDVEWFYNLRRNIFGFAYSRILYSELSDITNNSKGFTTGYEIQLVKKMGVISGWVSYAYNKSEFSSIIDNTTRYYTPNSSVPKTIKFALQFNFASWNISLVYNYASGKPYTIPIMKKVGEVEVELLFPDKINSERLNPMLRVDLSVVKKFDFDFAKGEIGLSIYNLLNHRNVMNRFYYPYYYQFAGSDEKFSKLLKSDHIDFEFTPSLFLNISF